MADIKPVPYAYDSKNIPVHIEHSASDLEKAYVGVLDESQIHAEGEEKTTAYIWCLTLAAAISGLLFGYDTGVVSGALVTIGTDLGRELKNFDKEMITSALTIGAFIGGLSGGVISDRIGRKWTLAVADVFFIVGAVMQAATNIFGVLVAGRFVMGLGVGSASCVTPLYLGELAPTRQRGRLVTINSLAITGGQVVAYGIGAGFAHVHYGWKWMIGLGAVPSAIQLCAMHWLPESPRILVRWGKHEEANAVMKKIYPFAPTEQINLKLHLIHKTVDDALALSNRTTFWQRLKGMMADGVNRRAVIVTAGLMAFQQLSGFNSLMYYSATLFKMTGFDNPTAVGLIVSGTNFAMTVVAFQWIDKIGRRRIMLWTTPGMVIGLVLAAVFFHYLTIPTGGELVEGTKYSTTWAGLVLFSMVFYVASYATGLGNVPWQQAELFDLQVRGMGTSIGTATCWAANFLIAATYLSLLEHAGPSGTFGVYAGICFLGVLFVAFFFPETTGLSLEETKLIFEEDFGIKKSLRLREEKKKAQALTAGQ